MVTNQKTNFKGYSQQQLTYLNIPIKKEEIPLAKIEIIKMKDIFENLYKSNIITQEFYNQYLQLVSSVDSNDRKIQGWFGDTWTNIKKGYWSNTVPGDYWGKFGYGLRSFEHLKDILMSL